MRSRAIAAIVVGAALGACAPHSTRPDTPGAATATSRSVFTDSTLHAEKCEPLLPDQDWRRVCTLKNQAPPLRFRP